MESKTMPHGLSRAAPPAATAWVALAALLAPAVVGAGQGPPPVRVAVAPMTSPEETVAANRDPLEYLAVKLGRPVQMKQRRTHQEVNDYFRTEMVGDAGRDEALFLDRLGDDARLGGLARRLAAERVALRARLDEALKGLGRLRAPGGPDARTAATHAQCEALLRDLLRHLFVEEQVLLRGAEACVEPERLEEIGAAMAALGAQARARNEIPATEALNRRALQAGYALVPDGGEAAGAAGEVARGAEPRTR